MDDPGALFLELGPSLLFRFRVSPTEDINRGGLGMRLAIHHVTYHYPRSQALPECKYTCMYCGESLVSFLHKYDIIKIGPKQKGNVLCVVQPTMLQRSVCMIFDAQ